MQTPELLLFFTFISSSTKTLAHHIWFLIEAEWRIYALMSWINTGSNNALLPVRHIAIICTNADILFTRSPGTYFNESLFQIQPFALKQMHLKMSSAKYRPSRIGLNIFEWKHMICQTIYIGYYKKLLLNDFEKL